MAKRKEKYDSLWDEEKKEVSETEDPIEVANNAEAFAEGSEIVEVADNVTSVTVVE